jgi:hypothetical protein
VTVALLQLLLAQSQLRDLTRQRHGVYREKEHIEKEEIRKVQLTLAQLTKDRKRIQARLAVYERKPEHAAFTVRKASGGQSGDSELQV